MLADGFSSRGHLEASERRLGAMWGPLGAQVKFWSTLAALWGPFESVESSFWITPREIIEVSKIKTFIAINFDFRSTKRAQEPMMP